MQIKKETDKITQSILEKQNDKTEIIENNPLFEIPFENNLTKSHTLPIKHIIANLSNNDAEDKSSHPINSRIIAPTKHYSDSNNNNVTILNKNNSNNNLQNNYNSNDDHEADLDKFKKNTKVNIYFYIKSLKQRQYYVSSKQVLNTSRKNSTEG